MALKRLTIKGYGQLELNQVAFRRDGRIEAQCKMADGIEYLENGMLLSVDNVKREVSKPAGNTGLIALNYSTEHMYDERKSALKDFKLDKGSFLPRLGYLAAGDKFTTNCIAYDSSEYNDDSAVIAALGNIGATPVYGKPCAEGAIQLTATKPTGSVVLQVVAKTTMPDGQLGVKFVALN